MQLLYDLKLSCEGQKPMQVELFPATASLRDRSRQMEERPWGVLHESIDVGRSVMATELEARMFLLRPSNARLVQCYMSKQQPIAAYLTEAQVVLAQTLYLTWLRTAANIAGNPVRAGAPPQKNL